MNAKRWLLCVCLGGAFASAVAEHGALASFAFSLRGASSNEVLEIAGAALAPMRFNLAEHTLSGSDASFRAVFRSAAANQIALNGTPDCVVATVTIEASSAARAEQIRRTVEQHFATNLRATAGTRVIIHGSTAKRGSCRHGPALSGRTSDEQRFETP